MMSFNSLPGSRRAYGVRNGQGPRHLMGGMVVSAYVTPAESEGDYALSMLTGGIGAGLPLMRHAAARVSLFVLDGVVELVMNGQRFHLSRGDSALIAPGTKYGLRMLRARTVAMWFQTGGAVAGMMAAVGTAYSGVIQPDTAPGMLEDLLHAGLQGCDTEILGPLPEGLPRGDLAMALPATAGSYAMAAGQGTHLVIADQLFTFAAANRHTEDQFLVLVNEGPAGQMVPPHMHLLHDELFFCLDGVVRLRNGDTEIELQPNDFFFVPRGTPHSYQFLHPYTRMLGWLTPGVFEPFFHTLGSASDLTVYPQVPEPFRGDRFGAAVAQFDIVPLGRPHSAEVPV
jgi:quercetin 2,3-dioxygenase